ncbi:hypothetical protein [Flavobacterium sp.]|uniref:hypothetical protein n=1 Tax=Flavobacterium sp. TaxID=239 RepID=UPI003527E13B
MPKIYKYLLFCLIVSSIFGTTTYYFLSNRHKAIVKTHVYHTLGFIDNNWNITENNHQFKLVTPTLLIDGIYKSMEGPKVSRVIQLNNSDDVYVITGFKIEAVDATTLKSVSKEFICHMNIDLNDKSYYTAFNLHNRIGKQFPRLTSLSSGFEEFSFPKGYGFIIKGNEPLFVMSEALNQNISPITKKIKHCITIDYEKYNGLQKPLQNKITYIRLPFDKYDPYKSPTDVGNNQCVPVETKNHTETDNNGNMLSGHWVIPNGKKTYRSFINSQLQIKDSLCLHTAAIHVHPFATQISLYDKTENKTIFTSKIENYKDKIGLVKVAPFSSKEGVWLYVNHEYELILDVNNTSKIDQDMMGSMFLFFYDKELDEKLKQSNN